MPGTDPGNTSERPAPKARALGVGKVWIAAGTILAALLFSAILGYNSGDRKSLRKYKAQLAAHGEKLSLLENVRQPSPKECDTTAILTATGNGLSSFGCSPGNLELMAYVSPGHAKIAWKQDTPPWMPGTPPAAELTWDEMHARMAQADDALEALRVLLSDPPALCHPPLTNLWQTIPNWVHIRLAAQWLAADAMDQLQRGRVEPALKDLEALAGCAQVGRDDLTLVAQMIRIAVAGLGLSATWEALQAQGWSEAQLARLQKAWEPVDLVDALETGFIAVRVGGNEVWTKARHGARPRQLRGLFVVNAATNLTFETAVSDYVLFPLYKMTSIDQDELFYLESIQGTIDSIRRVKKGQPWNAATDGLTQGCARLDKIAHSPQRYRHWLGLMVMPNFTRAVQIGVRTETLRQLALTTIAIRRHQMRHGALPLNLALLTPECLPRPGYDPLSGKSLQYIVRAEGGFLLYSVGQDGRDDGGETPFWYHGKNGMWDELDAIWPEPESRPREVSLLRP